MLLYKAYREGKKFLQYTDSLSLYTAERFEVDTALLLPRAFRIPGEGLGGDRGDFGIICPRQICVPTDLRSLSHGRSRSLPAVCNRRTLPVSNLRCAHIPLWDPAVDLR